MKIVILDGHLTNPGDISWKPIEKIGELTVYSNTSAEERVKNIADAEAVIVNRTKLDEKIFSQCPQIKYVGLLGTGYNYIELEAAKKRGITVCNVPGYSTYAVAQTAISLLLHGTNKVAEYNSYIKSGRWESEIDSNITALSLTELYGKTIGIVGYGAIGKRVAEIAMALGMKVLAYRRNPVTKEERENLKFVNLDTLLAQSDVVTIHCPLCDDTVGMMNKEAFAKMKDGAMFINTARGGLVDEQALSEALSSGHLSYAGLDVLSSEPPKADNPLLKQHNCVITPHVAWTPKQTRERLVQIVADNIAAFEVGKPQNVVNR
ncbi:MAG: D-2-hydroxyacid dehydrogenase [Oscillospiraceae bacterium]